MMTRKRQTGLQPTQKNVQNVMLRLKRTVDAITWLVPLYIYLLLSTNYKLLLCKGLQESKLQA